MRPDRANPRPRLESAVTSFWLALAPGQAAQQKSGRGVLGASGGSAHEGTPTSGGRETSLRVGPRPDPAARKAGGIQLSSSPVIPPLPLLLPLSLPCQTSVGSCGRGVLGASGGTVTREGAPTRGGRETSLIECGARRPHQEDRRHPRSHHLRGNTALHQAAQAGAAVGRHSDEVHSLLPGIVHNHSRRIV